MATIGKRNTLSIVRESAPGLYLNGGELGEVLLPRRYIPHNIAPKEKIDVFIYLDSDDRLVATTETPLVMVGEFAALSVVSLHPRLGAFLGWGLAKDLLLPFREQAAPVRVGQTVVAYVYLDTHTRRIVASTRLNQHLSQDTPAYRDGQPVSLLIFGRTPLGYNAIVANAHRGLLYHDKLAGPLTIGQKINGFVRTVLPDGKIDLSLDASGYKRVAPLTEQIIAEMENNGGRLMFDDNSSPESIRKVFGVSKKAFKQALGLLYKERRIRFENPGIQLLDNLHFSPGEKIHPPRRLLRPLRERLR